jgi:hypothetical protein
LGVDFNDLDALTTAAAANGGANVDLYLDSIEKEAERRELILGLGIEVEDWNDTEKILEDLEE